jgi:hypothetical protein
VKILIYEPQLFFNVQLAIGLAFFSAIERAVADYIIGEGKEWSYYLGYGFGGAALATGIQGAQATMYVIGAGTVKIFLEQAPGAAIAGVFLDGVQDANLNLDDELIDIVEHVLNIPDDGLQHTIMLYNFGTDPDSTNNPDNWLSILGIETTGVSLEEAIEMTYNTIVFRLNDAEADTDEDSLPVRVPTGFTLAQYQTFADAIAAEIDATTESVISEINITLALTIPGGVKTDPDDGALNERGGLITFDTSGPRADSVRIPAIKRDIMPGKTFSLSDTDIAALITRLTTATTAANIRPKTTQDYNFVTARKGSKSMRKR